MTLEDVSHVHAAVRAVMCGHECVVLAVSGGLDSMVLLDAASEIDAAPLVVATFDHGTGEWASSARSFVERSSAARGIRCVSGQAEVAGRGEAALRDARWRFLRSVSVQTGGVCATAHTADDQLETVMIRVLRGAGARGLAGLYADSDILRPLVHLTRGTLERYARDRGLEWMEDPSNISSEYLRNRVRHDLLPALRRVRPAIDDELLSVARAAADWRRDLDGYVDETVSPVVLPNRGGIDAPARDLAERSEWELRTLWPAILGRGGVVMDRRGINRLSDFTKRGRVGSRMPLSGGWEVVRSRDALELRPMRASGTTLAPLSLSNPTQCGNWVFRRLESVAEESLWVAWLPTDSNLLVREWRAGDAFLGRAGETGKKVKRLLSKAGVTGHKRAGWPVVLAGDQIVWIPGVRRSAAASDRSGRSGLPFMCEYVNC